LFPEEPEEPGELVGDWGSLEGNNWRNQAGWYPPIQYRCGWCGKDVGSTKGWQFSHPSGRVEARIRICPVCSRPTYFEEDNQEPGSGFGDSVQNLPTDVEALYNEARACTRVGASTPSVLALRKLLMNIAVNKGAKHGLSFLDYVEYLDSKGYVPPDGKGWVDHIRTKSNEANHEIALMTPSDTEELITFAEMLLKFIYEFPSRVPKKPQALAQRS
jgi:hypothetical protein